LTKHKDMDVREEALCELCEFDKDGVRDAILDYIDVLESIITDAIDCKLPTPKQEEILKILIMRK